jgi:hypothetical protein
MYLLTGAVFGSLAALSGCAIEVPDSKYLQISGKVTYHGEPVESGAIHFLPEEAGGFPASGVIEKGQIKDVTTRKSGDGILAGIYKVAISASEGPVLEGRTSSVPDPGQVERLAAESKSLIPPRYNNARDSGLRANVSPTNRVFDYELED